MENKHGAEENVHLFVLIHGLWGSPNHLQTVEKAVVNSLAEVSEERIVTLKPSSFRFWKTYDGIPRCASKVIADLFYEIETLKKNHKSKVSKISIVGYSLGGLISRYMIGVLYELGFFDEVQPVFFTTFATPHIGVRFFKKGLFDKTANIVGRYLFGSTGLELFLGDSAHLLEEMATPGSRYFEGLKLFEMRLLLANIKNDRSVAFFTSYITEYSPFDQMDSININYLKDLPSSKVGSATVWPKFVDLRQSHRITDVKLRLGNKQEATSFIRSNKLVRWTLLLSATVVLLPVYIPLIISLSLYVSGYSMVKIRCLSPLDLLGHWEAVKEAVFHGGTIDLKHAEQGESRRQERLHLARHESFKGDTSNLTENVMENMLLAEDKLANDQTNLVEENEEDENEEGSNTENVDDRDSEDEDNNESANDTDTATSQQEESPLLLDKDGQRKSVFSSLFKKKPLVILTAENDKAIEEHLAQLKSYVPEEYPLFLEDVKLPVLDTQKRMIDNLNSLDWVKIAVYHDLFNAHDGIVARRGAKTNPKGTCTIYLWASILRQHLKEC